MEPEILSVMAAKCTEIKELSVVRMKSIRRNAMAALTGMITEIIEMKPATMYRLSLYETGFDRSLGDQIC